MRRAVKITFKPEATRVAPKVAPVSAKHVSLPEDDDNDPFFWDNAAADWHWRYHESKCKQAQEERQEETA